MAWEKSGVPGTPTRTSWFDRDVPAMWRTLENQQSDDHWRLVAGWRKAADLTAIHLRRLEHYRTNLVEAWPPDRNAAAAAYVSRLDFLIQNVRTTHDVAAANYSTLAATVGALASARNDLKPLYDEYITKAKALTAYRELAAFNAAAEGSTVIGAAPVRPDDLERLNNRARAIMYTLSHTLVEAEAAIRQPPTYQFGSPRDPGTRDLYGKAGTPVDAPDGPTPGAREGLRVGMDGHASNAKQRMPTLPEVAFTRPMQPSQGIGRAGTAIPDLRPVAPNMPIQAGKNSSEQPLPDRLGQAIPTPLAPEGVIGPAPRDQTRPSHAPTRVNPIGGVIENHRLPGQPGMGQPIIAPLANQPQSNTSRRTRNPDRETHWELPSGVPQVISPPIEPRFDPGPVIGLNQ